MRRLTIATQFFISRAAKGTWVGGPHGRCTLCNGAMETLAHMRWSCPYTDHIRQEAQYRDVVLLDKSLKLLRGTQAAVPRT